MNDDKWADLVSRIEDQFGVLERGDEAMEDLPNGRREFVIFEGPLGTMMLERTTKPRVIGEKSFGGSKYGTGSGVEKIYSPDETVKTIKVYKDNDGDWVEMSGEGLV
jgi:hypothetical protein